MKCCDFKAADFRVSGEIQRRSRVADGQGGWYDGWVKFKAVKLKFKAASGAERLVAMQIQAEAKTHAYMRFTAPIPSPDMRLVCKGKTYNIRAVQDVEMLGKVIELTLEEGAAL